MVDTVWEQLLSSLTLVGVVLGGLDYVGWLDLGPWVSALNLGLLAWLVYEVTPRLAHGLDRGRRGEDSAFVGDPRVRLGLLVLTVPWFLAWLPHASFAGSTDVFGWRPAPADPLASILLMIGLLLTSSALVGWWLHRRDPHAEGVLHDVLENAYRMFDSELAERELAELREAAGPDPGWVDRGIVSLSAYAAGTVVTLPLGMLGLTAAFAWSAEAFVYVGAGVAAGLHLLAGSAASFDEISRAAEGPQRALFAWRVRELDFPRIIALLYIVVTTVVTVLGYAAILAQVGPTFVELLGAAASGVLDTGLSGSLDRAATLTDLVLLPAALVSLLASTSVFSLVAWTRLAQRLDAWPSSGTDSQPDAAPLPPASDLLYPLLHLSVGGMMLALSAGLEPEAWSPGTGWLRLLASLGGLAGALALAAPGIVALRSWSSDRASGGNARWDRVRVIGYALAPIAAFTIGSSGRTNTLLLAVVMVVVYALPELDRGVRRVAESRFGSSLASSLFFAGTLTLVTVVGLVAFGWPVWILALPGVALALLVGSDVADRLLERR